MRLDLSVLWHVLFQYREWVIEYHPLPHIIIIRYKDVPGLVYFYKQHRVYWYIDRLWSMNDETTSQEQIKLLTSLSSILGVEIEEEKDRIGVNSTVINVLSIFDQKVITPLLFSSCDTLRICTAKVLGR